MPVWRFPLAGRPVPPTVVEEPDGSHPGSWGGTRMSKARDVMHVGAECIGENDALARAAAMMRNLSVGALPICSVTSTSHR